MSGCICEKSGMAGSSSAPETCVEVTKRPAELGLGTEKELQLGLGTEKELELGFGTETELELGLGTE